MKELLRPAPPASGRHVLFIGAGISREEPTGFPMAGRILSGLLSTFAPEEPVRRFLLNLADPTRPGKQGPGDYIRLEQLLEATHALVDPDLSVLRFVELYTTPNPTHLLLARRAIAGDIVVTTNFDGLIEGAIAMLGSVPVSICDALGFERWETAWDGGRVPVFKLHGSYSRHGGDGAVTPSLATVQATLERVAAGAVMRLPEPRRSFLIDCARGRSLVVVGYSGTDDLDIMPTFLELEPSDVCWIEHEHGHDTRDVTQERREQVMTASIPELTARERFLRGAFERGADLSVLRAETRPFLYERFGERMPEGTTTPGDDDRFERFLMQWKTDRLTSEHQRLMVTGGLLKTLSRPSQAFEHLAAADEHCRRVAPASRDRARIGCFAAGVLVTLGRLAEAEQWILQAQQALPPEQDRLHAVVLHQRGFVAYSRGRLDEAADLHRSAERVARAAGDKGIAAQAIHDLAIVHQDRAEYDVAKRLYEESIKLASAEGQIQHVAFTYHQLGTLEYDRAELAAARRSFESARDLSSTLGDRSVVANALHGLGLVDFMSGDLDRALEEFRASAGIEEELGRSAFLPISWQHLASTHAERGELVEADRLFRRAAEGYRAVPDEANLSDLLGFQAVYHLESGRLDEAREAAAEALELAQRAGMAPNAIRAAHARDITSVLAGSRTAASAVVSSLFAAEDIGARALLLDLVYVSARFGAWDRDDGRLRSIAAWTERLYTEVGNLRRATVVSRARSSAA